ncbi:MAG TPA: response regulator [Gemmatimonadaceae bacterium]|nr:response regulator [Gemmatimonadaceae bacterium]
MATPQPLVLVVDDDESIRQSLVWLLTSVGYAVETHASGVELLARSGTDKAVCLLLDVRLPDMTGLAVRDELARRGLDVATVFITGYDDVATGVRAIKGGAEDFLLKPFDDADVLDAVGRAIRRAIVADLEQRQFAEIAERYNALTPRQHEVCDRVVAGRLNKQIAAELGMCEQTVKVHRSRVMHKMRVQSLADLVRAVDRFHRFHRFHRPAPPSASREPADLRARAG